MNIKLRVIILLLTVTIIIQQVLSAIFHKSVSVVLTIIAALGLIYLVLTAEESIFKRIKIRNRKILSSDGEYKEHPEFRKMYYDIVGKNIKEYRKIIIKNIKLYLLFFVFVGMVIFSGDFPARIRAIIMLGSAFLCMVSMENGLNKIYIIKEEFIKKFYSDFTKKINKNFVFTLGDKEKQKTMLDLKCCFNRDAVFDYSVYGIVNGYVENNVYLKIIDIRHAMLANFIGNKGSAKKFKGIVALSELVVDIDGRLKITKNRENISDEDKKEKVLLDNTMFESVYNVFSPDRIFAMRILTPEIMELLTEFDKYSIEFDLIIVYNKIIIRFYEDNMFDFSFARRAFNREDMFLTYCIMKFSEDLINAINKSLKGYIA